MTVFDLTALLHVAAVVPLPEPSGVTFMPCLSANTINPTKNTPQTIPTNVCIRAP